MSLAPSKPTSFALRSSELSPDFASGSPNSDGSFFMPCGVIALSRRDSVSSVLFSGKALNSVSAPASLRLHVSSLSSTTERFSTIALAIHLAPAEPRWAPNNCKISRLRWDRMPLQIHSAAPAPRSVFSTTIVLKDLQEGNRSSQVHRAMGTNTAEVPTPGTTALPSSESSLAESSATAAQRWLGKWVSSGRGKGSGSSRPTMWRHSRSPSLSSPMPLSNSLCRA
mmetsp:Transcript_56576/g.150841  ORF Transcript_56576/g.150841 Transcript_56576/m.150841 type:complete len:225 (+) Transcript_56576:328-1002(+)